MNSRNSSKQLAVILLFLSATSLGILSCEKNANHTARTTDTVYTCPMHPNIVRDDFGSCPVCGMDLVPISKNEEAKRHLTLTSTQIQLGNIKTSIAKVSAVGMSTIVNGRLVVNQDESTVISSRTSGRIEKLFIKETGQFVRTGDALYTVYSEELLTLQQEYLLAKEQYEQLGKSEPRLKGIFDGAYRKLILYGLTPTQINHIRRDTQLSSVTFVSPASGVVSGVNVSEGETVQEGTKLYTVEDLRQLWVEAELYPHESSLANIGDSIQVKIQGAPGSINTVINFLNPELRSNSHILVLRALLPNPELLYKPGQEVSVTLKHSKRKAIAVPIDAVVRDAKGTHVYIQEGRNTFAPKMVKTGVENSDEVEIIDGISTGDTVVVSGAYLLYSEMVLKKGGDPMAGHSHSH